MGESGKLDDLFFLCCGESSTPLLSGEETDVLLFSLIKTFTGESGLATSAVDDSSSMLLAGVVAFFFLTFTLLAGGTRGACSGTESPSPASSLAFFFLVEGTKTGAKGVPSCFGERGTQSKISAKEAGFFFDEVASFFEAAEPFSSGGGVDTGTGDSTATPFDLHKHAFIIECASVTNRVNCYFRLLLVSGLVFLALGGIDLAFTLESVKSECNQPAAFFSESH